MTNSAIRSGRDLRAGLGVVILGAGASLRMGRPKLLLPWGNTSVIGHLLRQWERLGARQVAVVCRANDRRLAVELDRLGLPARNRVVNPAPERGMFSSVVCAANWHGWVRGLTAWAIVLGDQPHLRLAGLRGLLKFQRGHPERICQPSYGGHGRHPILLPGAAWGELAKSSAGDLKEFLRHATGEVAQCPLDDAGLELDLDTPEDYEQLLRAYPTVKLIGPGR
jgi:molybdenum cofactor cytidylyltransferase